MLDVLCTKLSGPFPVLQEVRSALYPCVYMDLPVAGDEPAVYSHRRMWCEGGSTEAMDAAQTEIRHVLRKLEKATEEAQLLGLELLDARTAVSTHSSPPPCARTSTYAHGGYVQPRA